MPLLGWLRCGRHIRRPAACPDSSCESREALHMHIGIDMQVEMRVERQGAARGRAAAPEGMSEDGLEAVARSMAEQGR